MLPSSCVKGSFAALPQSFVHRPAFPASSVRCCPRRSTAPSWFPSASRQIDRPVACSCQGIVRSFGPVNNFARQGFMKRCCARCAKYRFQIEHRHGERSRQTFTPAASRAAAIEVADLVATSSVDMAASIGEKTSGPTWFRPPPWARIRMISALGKSPSPGKSLL